MGTDYTRRHRCLSIHRTQHPETSLLMIRPAALWFNERLKLCSCPTPLPPRERYVIQNAGVAPLVATNADALEASTPPTVRVSATSTASSTPEPVTALTKPVAEAGTQVSVNAAVAADVSGDDDAVTDSYQRECSDGEGGEGEVEVEVEVEDEGWVSRGGMVNEADADDRDGPRSLDTSREVSVEGDASFR